MLTQIKLPNGVQTETETPALKHFPSTYNKVLVQVPQRTNMIILLSSWGTLLHTVHITTEQRTQQWHLKHGQYKQQDAMSLQMYLNGRQALLRGDNMPLQQEMPCSNHTGLWQWLSHVSPCLNVFGDLKTHSRHLPYKCKYLRQQFSSQGYNHIKKIRQGYIFDSLSRQSELSFCSYFSVATVY